MKRFTAAFAFSALLLIAHSAQAQQFEDSSVSAVVVRVDSSLLRSMGAPIPVGIGAQMQVWVRSKEPSSVLQVAVRYRCQDKRYSSLKFATMTDSFGVVLFDLAEACTSNMAELSLTVEPQRPVSSSTFSAN